MKANALLRLGCAFVMLACFLPACVSVRRPAFPLRPREVGTFGGTIAVEPKLPEDITECVSHQSASSDGSTYAADFTARDGQRVTVTSTSAPSRLAIGDGASARVVPIARSDCARHDVHFFVREGNLHGSASLDCQTSEGRVVVSAHFDNCRPTSSPSTRVERSPFHSNVVVR